MRLAFLTKLYDMIIPWQHPGNHFELVNGLFVPIPVLQSLIKHFYFECFYSPNIFSAFLFLFDTGLPKLPNTDITTICI